MANVQVHSEHSTKVLGVPAATVRGIHCVVHMCGSK